MFLRSKNLIKIFSFAFSKENKPIDNHFGFKDIPT